MSSVLFTRALPKCSSLNALARCCIHDGQVNVKEKNVTENRKQKNVALRVADALSVNEEIVVPKRINRGPTDLLKALASTVSRDFTAPHYKYHDDPFLIPSNNVGKRMFALSKESGQKAARWIVDNNPHLFQENPTKNFPAPAIEKFMPSTKYDEKSEVSEDTLKFCIAAGEVQNSITVFKLLASKGDQMTDECKQSLLELLCFYNSTEPLADEYKEERWFRQTVQHQRKTWTNGGIADELFSSFDVKTPEAYCAMIRGMAKYIQVDRAITLYSEMIEKQMPIDLQTYNALIPLAYYLKESGEQRWQMCQEFLIGMRSANIHPDLRTFNAVLEVLSRSGNWKESKMYSLRTLGEMKHLGIEPSLGTYYFILNIFCRERGPRSTILKDIMREIEGKEFEVRDSNDVFFFVTAMQACHDHIMDLNIALKIDELLHSGHNEILIGDAMRESIYFQNFFKILCKAENVDNFFEHYNKLVPNVYIPEPSVMEAILELIELYGDWKYIPLIWTDIVTFDHFSRTRILEKVADILANAVPEEKELQQQFGAIASNIQEGIDTQREEKIRSVIHWTGTLLGNLVQTFVNAGEHKKATNLFQKVDTESSRIMGAVNEGILRNYIDACISTKNATESVRCVRYAAEIGAAITNELAKKVLDSLTLTELQRIKVSSVLSSMPEEENKASADDSVSSQMLKKEE